MSWVPEGESSGNLGGDDDADGVEDGNIGADADVETGRVLARELD